MFISIFYFVVKGLNFYPLYFVRPTLCTLTRANAYPSRVGNLARSLSSPSPALNPATEKMSLQNHAVNNNKSVSKRDPWYILKRNILMYVDRKKWNNNVNRKKMESTAYITNMITFYWACCISKIQLQQNCRSNLTTWYKKNPVFLTDLWEVSAENQWTIWVVLDL